MSFNQKSRMRHHLYVIHLRGFMFVLPARFLCSIIHERNTICKGFFQQKRNDYRITIHILQLNIGAAYV